MEATGETRSEDPKTWTINFKKILTVENEINSVEEEAQILNLPKNAKKLLQNLKVENFPRVFVILIDFDEEIDEILKLIAHKFTNRPFVLQVKSGNSVTFYIKRENEFKKVESASVSVEAQTTVKLATELTLLSLKTSLIDAKFTNLLSSLANKDLTYVIRILAFNSDDELCYRLFNLFDTNFTSKLRADLLTLIVKSSNFNFFLAFFHVFDASRISESQIEDILTLKGDENAFMLAVNCRNVEVVKFLLNFTSKLPQFFDFELFTATLKLAVDEEFLEVYGLLVSSHFAFTEDEKVEILKASARDGFSDLFIATLKSLNSSNFEFYVENLTTEFDDIFKAFFTFLADTKKNARKIEIFSQNSVELKFQAVLNELFSRRDLTRKLLEKTDISMLVTAHGFESNIKLLFATIDKNFSNDEAKKLLLKKSEIFYWFVSTNKNIASIKFLWSFYEKNFTNDEIVEFIHKGTTNLLQNAVYKNQSREIIEFLWLKIQSKIKDREKLKEFLIDKNRYGSNVLNISAFVPGEAFFDFIFEKIYCEFFELKEFIYETNLVGENFYQSLVRLNALSRLEFATNQLKRGLSSDDFMAFIRIKGAKSKNIFHYAALNDTYENGEKFLASLIESDELKKMLSEGDEEGFLPFHDSVRFTNNTSSFINFIKLYEENFSTAEVEELLRSRNLITLAHKSGNPEVYEEVKNVLKKYFDPMVSYFIEFLELNQCNKLEFWTKVEEKSDVLEFLLLDRCFNLFQFMATFFNALQGFEFMWLKIKFNHKNEENLKKMLMLKDPQGFNGLFLSLHAKNQEIFNFLFEKVYCEYFKLEEVIFDVDKGGENLFYALVKHGTASMLKTVTEKLMKELSFTKFTKLVNSKNKAQQNIFHAAAIHNKSKESLTMLLNLLSKDDVKKMLLQPDDNYLFPLHLTVKTNTADNFQLLLDFYQNNFEERIVVATFLVHEKSSGKKFLTLSDDPEMFNVMTKYLDQHKNMMMMLTVEMMMSEKFKCN